MNHARTLPLLTLVGLTLSVAAAVANEAPTLTAAKALAVGDGKPVLIDFWMPG